MIRRVRSSHVADKPALSPTFCEMAEQPAAFASELENLAAANGDDIDETPF